MWSLDGKELFFETGPNLLAVIPIETRPAFSPVGKPTTVPGGTLGSAAPSATRNRDIDPEGKRFITQVNGGTSDRPEIRLIQNWFEELKRLVPTN
jgi:hypothetical protein